MSRSQRPQFVLHLDNDESCCDFSSRVGGVFQNLKGAVEAYKKSLFEMEGSTNYFEAIQKWKGTVHLASYDQNGVRTWQRPAASTK